MPSSIRDVTKKSMSDGEPSSRSLREGAKNPKSFRHSTSVIGNIISTSYIFYKWDLKLLAIKRQLLLIINKFKRRVINANYLMIQ